jgi:hypothetical protein
VKCLLEVVFGEYRTQEKSGGCERGKFKLDFELIQQIGAVYQRLEPTFHLSAMEDEPLVATFIFFSYNTTPRFTAHITHQPQPPSPPLHLRFVFGLGGESLTVANSALLADWFKGKELAFAFGVNLSIAKIGSVINNILSPALNSAVSLVFAMWVGSLLCVLGVVLVLMTWPIDKHFDDVHAAAESRYCLITPEDTGMVNPMLSEKLVQQNNDKYSEEEEVELYNQQQNRINNVSSDSKSPGGVTRRNSRRSRIISTEGIVVVPTPISAPNSPTRFVMS